MGEVLKSRHTLVIEKKGKIIVKARKGSMLAIIAGEIVVAVLAYTASGRRITADGALERLCFLASIVLIAFAALMSLILALQSATSKTVFDVDARTMRRGGKRFDLSRAGGLEVQSRPFADKQLHFLCVNVDGRQLRIASETDPADLRKAASLLEGRLGSRPAAEGAAVAAEASASDAAQGSPRAGSAFIGAFLIAFGALWGGGGYFFLRDVIFTMLPEYGGPLLWPFGLWLIALGACELARIPLFRRMLEGRSRGKAVALIVFFGSYLLICWRV